MKFAYYRSLANCFDVSIEKLDNDSLSHLRDKAEDYFKSNDSLRCEKQTLSMTEVFALIDSLKNAPAIVFHDWIKSDKALSIILQSNEENLNFQETINNQKYKGHALEKQFYSFLTPFLYSFLEKEISESFAGKDFEKLRFYLQYSDFIEESKKIALQQEVDRQLRSMFSDLISDFRKDDLGELNTSPKKEAEAWKRNSKEIKLLASLDLVDILNLLDKQFYALRVSYIDTVKDILVQPNIEPTTFKMLSRAIRSVKLNNSHKSQVDSFLNHGKVKFYQKQRTTVFNKALLRNPLIYLGFIVVIILILLVFPFDFKNTEPPKNEKISGLDSLSQDEVKKTDSLLAFKEDSVLFQTEDMPVPVALPDFILSDNTNDIKNASVVKLYESMLADYEIQQNNGGTNCDPLEGSSLKGFNYNNVDDIQLQFANHKFINESSDDCYLLFFENKEDGNIFGELVPAGGSKELKIVKNWRVIFYTGKEFTTFNPLKISNNGYGNLEDAKKIDKSFTTHFCEMNYSNFRILSKIYHVETIGKTTRLVNNSGGSLEIQSKSIKATK